MREALTLAAALALAIYATPAARADSVRSNALRDAYYGDLHLHTSYSFDAFLVGWTKADPGQAYRFARGEIVDYLGHPIQRREPLDFLAVTDHAESLGVFNLLDNADSAISRSEAGKQLRDLLAPITDPDGARHFERMNPNDIKTLTKFMNDYFVGGKKALTADIKALSRTAWQREMDFANRYYVPGKFTTFIAYEWTSAPDASNLHRNVIFKGNSAPNPFTSQDSNKPEDLWSWLDSIRAKGYEALAIPHNANASNGLMYDWVKSDGQLIDRAYAEDRQANEPLSEISQNKGASETHPLLSSNDEFADYEIYDFMAPNRGHESRPGGSYLRDALSRGLVLQQKIGVNPYKYGFVGGSDLHSGFSVSAQADFIGGHAGTDMGFNRPTKEAAADILNGQIDAPHGHGVDRLSTAGSLTGVWAESNTRDSIYSALRRKETFATTGTRLKFRFFGGWNFKDNLLRQKDWVAAAYKSGVPMGSDLPAKPAEARAPIFAIWAVKDPNGANLDRVQVVKVWEENGAQKEKVFDVAAAGNTIGVTELAGVWVDPGFDPHHLAAYYLRVLEIPTPRWSTLLAHANDLPLPKDVPAMEQQRGWSSPIWYVAL